MAKFVTGSQLNAEIEKLFEEADRFIIIISPFIKLHSRIKDILNSGKNDKLKIIIVFGKNEGKLSKSLSNDEFNFLKSMPNIEIKYEPRLHAKYYANDFNSVLSSMNLYDYSQNNNIEFGIVTSGSLIGDITGGSIDSDAIEYFDNVIKNSELLYKNTPIYEKSIMGLSKKYISSKVEVDNLSAQLNGASYKQQDNSSNDEQLISEFGYCIRTGVKIPFNVEMPYSKQAFKSWERFRNKDYKEKYCHFSGESSNGETSFSKPILKKNWSKAKRMM